MAFPIAPVTRPDWWRCALLVVLVAGLMGGCDQPPPKSDREFIRSATELRDSGRLPAAVDELKEALLVNPRNTEARWMLGQVYLILGEGAGAEKELRQAARLGIGWEDLVGLVASAKLLEGDAAGALEILDNFQGPIGQVQTAKLAAVRGEVLSRLDRPGAAARAYASALEGVPPPIQAYIGDALLYLAHGDAERARRSLTDATDMLAPAAPAADQKDAAGAGPYVDFDAFDLACAQGRLAMQTNDAEGARVAFQRVLEQAPEFALVRRCAYRNLIAMALLSEDERAKSLKAGLKREFRDVVTLMLIDARHALVQGHLVMAQNGFEGFMQRQSGGTADVDSARFLLALAHARQGQWQQALDLIDTYTRRHPRDVFGVRLRAIVDTGLHRYQRAADGLIDRLWRQPQDSESLTLLGALMLHDRTQDLLESPKVDHVLTAMATDFPFSPYALPVVDRAASAPGFWSWIEANAGLNAAELSQLRDWLRLDMGQELDLLLEKLQLTRADQPATWLLTARVGLERGNDLEALQAAQKAEALAPGTSLVAYYLAYARDVAGGGRGVKGGIGQLSAAYRDFAPAQVLATAAAIRAGDLEGASDHLNALVGISADQTMADLRVHLAMARGDDEAALALLEAELKIRPEAPELHLLNAQLKADTKDWGGVSASLSTLPKAYLERPMVRRLRAVAALATGAPKVAVAQYQALLDRDPDEPSLLEALARAQLAAGDGGAAMRLARRLQLAQPGENGGYRLEGDVSVYLGHPRDAALAYQSAYNLTPDRRLVVSLAKSWLAAGDAARAVAVISDWLVAHPGDAELCLLQAQALWDIGEHDKARGSLESLLADTPAFDGRGDAEALLKTWRSENEPPVSTEGGSRDATSAAAERGATEPKPMDHDNDQAH